MWGSRKLLRSRLSADREHRPPPLPLPLFYVILFGWLRSLFCLFTKQFSGWRGFLLRLILFFRFLVFALPNTAVRAQGFSLFVFLNADAVAKVAKWFDFRCRSCL